MLVEVGGEGQVGVEGEEVVAKTAEAPGGGARRAAPTALTKQGEGEAVVDRECTGAKPMACGKSLMLLEQGPHAFHTCFAELDLRRMFFSARFSDEESTGEASLVASPRQWADCWLSRLRAL